jgi:hypothetical protein
LEKFGVTEYRNANLMPIERYLQDNYVYGRPRKVSGDCDRLNLFVRGFARRLIQDTGTSGLSSAEVRAYWERLTKVRFEASCQEIFPKLLAAESPDPSDLGKDEHDDWICCHCSEIVSTNCPPGLNLDNCSCSRMDTFEDDRDLPLTLRNIHNYHIGICKAIRIESGKWHYPRPARLWDADTVAARGTREGLPQVDNGRRFSEERNIKQENVNDYEDPPSVKATLGPVALGTNEENLQLLNQVDQLRECRVDKYIDLPQIVVRGDQSSGKSSILEAITGIPFPRSSIKTIPKETRPEALQLLRKYYTDVCLKGRVSSDGSRTSAPARSEASTGTSITDNAHTFSMNNRPVKRERARKPLDSVMRARKALLRKLGACQEDCRRRKVKVIENRSKRLRMKLIVD